MCVCDKGVILRFGAGYTAQGILLAQGIQRRVYFWRRVYSAGYTFGAGYTAQGILLHCDTAASGCINFSTFLKFAPLTSKISSNFHLKIFLNFV
jgi:hypothetical protein